MSNILDPRFKYTPAHETDIRKTFAKARRRMAQEKAEREVKVTQLRREKKHG